MTLIPLFEGWEPERDPKARDKESWADRVKRELAEARASSAAGAAVSGHGRATVFFFFSPVNPCIMRSRRGRERRANVKYKNTPTQRAGIVHRSRAEAARADHLDALRAAGVVAAWSPQPSFALGIDVRAGRLYRYVADFLVAYADGRVVVEDVKGVETDRFRRTVDRWIEHGVVPLAIVRRTARGWAEEIVEPRRRA